jgi:hypothetical protein
MFMQVFFHSLKLGGRDTKTSMPVFTLFISRQFLLYCTPTSFFLLFRVPLRILEGSFAFTTESPRDCTFSLTKWWSPSYISRHRTVGSISTNTHEKPCRSVLDSVHIRTLFITPYRCAIVDNAPYHRVV